ncbi:hypothetical protein METBIDRAFT_12825 [Metschnikowia bicuspidata var. bicuspidata NRRL YB-4993]|uniref:N-acetyltransferase domain-containing protein n=1 Tax=Metschnikowia bicuspidata var. bicuspidata NRRL YB-4993 TaxID=869754 RepID=A0A1A0H744_9ASCO|nr:hypothetical protein METBIDRAFT_12825 [Metschnikowia bicuspidata var. bicuspidata NRRL YB-4993]OBA19780.1 hypothetical protein METBIDRAFT_12825 [Metschnikowia bicuspidata var. bicuspidata NRRL YB-4993]
MFSVIPEDHETSPKRKPRLPQSQGASTGILNNPSSLRLTLVHKLLNISISPVSILDYRRVAKTLALAFDKDPFVNYILSTQIEYSPHQTRLISRKHQLMLSFFEFSVYECMSVGGLVLAVKDNNLELDLIRQQLKPPVLYKIPYLGAACWNKLVYDRSENCFDYPSSRSSLANIHPTSLKFSLFSSLAKCKQKILRVVEDQLHRERDFVFEQMLSTGSSIKTSDTIWYLGDVCIIPSMQGRGLAKKLMIHCLGNYMIGHWCYLESSNAANRKFYEKLGWSLKKTFVVDEEFSEHSSDDRDFWGSNSRDSSFNDEKKSSTRHEILYMDSFVMFAGVLAQSSL